MYSQLIIYCCFKAPVVRPNDTRLSKDLIPYLYDLEFKPYIGLVSQYGNRSFTFDGKAKIHFTCKVATDLLQLHIRGLTINNASITISSTTDPSLQLENYWVNDFLREFFKINFNKKCTVGHNYTFSVDYTGPIGSILAGFYRSSYVDRDSGERV